MRQVKLRRIAGSGQGIVLGVTIPVHIAQKFEGSYFHVSHQDGCILLVSGCVVQNTEVKKGGEFTKI